MIFGSGRIDSMTTLLLIFVVAGCAAPVAPHVGGGAAGDVPAIQKRRITAGAQLLSDLLPGTGSPGQAEIHALVNPGLSIVDHAGGRRALLVEQIPSLDNGSWTLYPDGRMETTWRLRPGVSWHDGIPLTADDLAFTIALGQDREIGFGHQGFASIAGAQVTDPHTLVVTWKQPYIEADAMFSRAINGAFALPVPRHRLEEPYREDKAGLKDLSFWTEDFVGAGPFRVREWIPATHILLAAFPEFVAGRPRIDEVEIRFVTDANVLLANLLAGELDVTLAAFRSLDQALPVREQWAAGTVAFEFGISRWYALYPQLLNPTPAVVADVRFRKAVMHAIDRQEMAETLQAGLAPVADSFLSPNQPQYRDIEARLVRYEYDPRRAAQLIEALGYVRAPDGVFRDAAGHRLDLEVASIAGLYNSALSVADYLNRVGIAATPFSVSPQRAQNFELEATFPALRIFTANNDVGAIRALHSRQARLPENNFQVAGGNNWSRYANPDFDSLIDRYYATIPLPDRTAVLGQIIHHVSDQLNVMGLVYTAVPEAIANRLVGVTTGRAGGSLISWNSHEWNVK